MVNYDFNLHKIHLKVFGIEWNGKKICYERAKQPRGEGEVRLLGPEGQICFFLWAFLKFLQVIKCMPIYLISIVNVEVIRQIIWFFG